MEENFIAQFYHYLLNKYGKEEADSMFFSAFQKERRAIEEIDFEQEIKKPTSGKPDL